MLDDDWRYGSEQSVSIPVIIEVLVSSLLALYPLIPLYSRILPIYPIPNYMAIGAVREIARARSLRVLENQSSAPYHNLFQQ